MPRFYQYAPPLSITVPDTFVCLTPLFVHRLPPGSRESADRRSCPPGISPSIVTIRQHYRKTTPVSQSAARTRTTFFSSTSHSQSESLNRRTCPRTPFAAIRSGNETPSTCRSKCDVFRKFHRYTSRIIPARNTLSGIAVCPQREIRISSSRETSGRRGPWRIPIAKNAGPRLCSMLVPIPQRGLRISAHRRATSRVSG